MKIIGVGDIMPGGLLSGTSKSCATEDVLAVLLDADIRIGTLECALGNEPTYDAEKVADRGNVIYAKEDDVKRLKELHIDIVSLANNHFFDLGEIGAKRTIELLDAANIMHIGAGSNLDEASKPVVIRKEEKTIAFLAFCDTDYNNVFWCTYATMNTPGVNPMTEEHVITSIKQCAQENDIVVVFPHWGTEHVFYPNLSTYRMAKVMIDAGADIILGSHPHRIQPTLSLNKKYIVYSMGNFLFPERLIAPPKVTYYSDVPIDVSTLPITDGYPKVKSVTLKTLPYLQRVGMIIKVEIGDDGVVLDSVLTYLNKENCIELLCEKDVSVIQKKLFRITIPMKFHVYPTFVKTKEFALLLYRKLKSYTKWI